MPPARPPRHVLGALAAAGLAVTFFLLLLHANPNLCWNDDYAISILPVLTDIARSWREGHWPLLSPDCWACGNLAGEYQYGTFSLFINAVIVAVWQFPMSFPARAAAMSGAHLAVLAAGAFLLARRRRLTPPLATVVALAAALNGWIIGWGATDWFGALAAEAWLPWCWWAFELAMFPRAGLSGESGWRGAGRWWLPAPFVYLLLTAGFPYTVVMLALVSAWLAARALARRRPRALAPLVAGWAFGIGLAAPAWLSLLTYMAGSNRSQGAGAGNFAWTVPLSAWPGMILPNWTTTWRDFGNHPGTHSALELSGALVPLVGLAVALACRPRALWRAARWELALAGVVLGLCVLPSPGVFRWSFRWLPLFHLALALAGARALGVVLICRREAFGVRRHDAAFRRRDMSRPIPGQRPDWLWGRHVAPGESGVVPPHSKTGTLRRCLWWNPGAWAYVVITLAWVTMTLAHTANADALTHNLPWLTLVAAAVWMVGDALLARRVWAMWLPAAMVFASLWITYRHSYTNPGLPVYAFGPALERVAPLSPDRLYVGFYNEPDQRYRNWQTGPDFGAVLRPGSTAMFAGVHFLNGYSPIMAQGVGRRLAMETHGNIANFVAEDLLRHETGRDGLLARLGVDGMVIAREYYPLVSPPPDDEWETVFSSKEGTVYHRRGGALPPVRGDGQVKLGRVENSRLSVAVDVDASGGTSPAVVSFRRPFFPGYEASLDGAPQPVTSYEGLIPTVELPPGSHGRLTLRYRPRAVTWGAGLAAASLLGMAGAGASWRVRGAGGASRRSA